MCIRDSHKCVSFTKDGNKPGILPSNACSTHSMTLSSNFCLMPLHIDGTWGLWKSGLSLLGRLRAGLLVKKGGLIHYLLKALDGIVYSVEYKAEILPLPRRSNLLSTEVPVTLTTQQWSWTSFQAISPTLLLTPLTRPTDIDLVNQASQSKGL